MKIATKVYIAAAAALAFLIIAAGLISSLRTRSLEGQIERSVQNAETLEHKAAEAETDSAAHREKISYLERQLAELKQTGRRQDEKLETLNNNSRAAREHADRARRTSSVASNARELCKKLADLGHPCE
jgi:chromosome segregation ATPase